mgnify:CR=1 FL=1
MLLKGDVTIQAPRKKVWDFLTDPNQIGQCVPGLEDALHDVDLEILEIPLNSNRLWELTGKSGG